MPGHGQKEMTVMDDINTRHLIVYSLPRDFKALLGMGILQCSKFEYEHLSTQFFVDSSSDSRVIFEGAGGVL